MIYRYLFVVWLLLIGVGPALAQQLTPAQQAELDKAAREAKAEFEKVTDPAYMSRLFDEQIRDARKNGASPELIRELEQAKKDALKQLRELKANPNPQPVPEPADNTASDKAQTDLLASLKGRLARPDTVAPVMYDEQEGRYNRIPAAFRVYAEAKLTPEKFVAFMQQQFGVTLEQDQVYVFDNQTTIRYQQRHDGYAVALVGYAIVLNKNSYVERATGDLLLITATAPSVRPPNQLLAALRTATKLPALPLLPLLPDNPATVPPAYAQALPLVWISPRLNLNQPPVLTQPFDVLTPGSERRWYLNVQTGAVVATENLRRTCVRQDDPPQQYVRRTVRTYHAQNREVGVSRVTRNNKVYYELIDSSAAPRVFIRYPGYDQPESTKDTTLADQALFKKGAFDALWGFRQTATYFGRLGLRSFDRRNADIVAESINEDNAYWSEKKNRFGYGIVNGIPYANLSTIGHEFTHAINTYTAKLVYQGESGALDESISDMFGTCIEHTLLGGNWVLDDEIWVQRGGIRNMANPPAKGHPDTYGETHWADTASPDDKGGVHTNSGVGNKWFYLLIKGGKGQNDLKNPFDIKTTLSYAQMARLLLSTLFRLSPTSGYEDFCRETIATAENQLGPCSEQTMSVKQAWYAVGVLDDPPVSPCNPGWTMDMVMKGDGQRQVIKLYFKGDSSVAVVRTPDAIIKTFTRRSSPVINTVFQDKDGLQAAVMPKNISAFMRNVTDNVMPAQEAILKQGIEEARAELRNPDTSPERRADIQRGLPIAERQLQHLKEGAAEAKAMQQDLEAGNIPKSDLQFWETRKARRQFDKDHIKATQLYQGKYLAKKYEVGGGMYWWTTAQIPLRMSDLLQASVMMPVSLMQNGLDHWLRGFPIQYHEMFRIQNILETSPSNFDALFSTAPVFD